MGSETELLRSYPPPRALWLSVQKKKGKGDRKGDWGPSAWPNPLGACAVRCGGVFSQGEEAARSPLGHLAWVFLTCSRLTRPLCVRAAVSLSLQLASGQLGLEALSIPS